MAPSQIVCSGFPGIHNYEISFSSVGNTLKKWTNNHHGHNVINHRIQAVELGVSEVTGDTGRTGKLKFCNAFLFCGFNHNSDLGSYNFLDTYNHN